MTAYPSIRQLQYLQTLYETRSFSRAAQLCHVTQPTLSAGISEMENLLGLPVLDRSRRKNVVFTLFGEEVVKTANETLPRLESLMVKAKSMARPLSGPLRMGLIPTMAPYLLPKILPILQKKFKEIDFRITEDITANLLQKIHSGKIDMAFMAFPYDTPDLHQEVFSEEPFICAAPKGLFKNKKIRIADLKGQNVLLLEEGHCLRDHALSACKLASSRHSDSLSATSLQTLVQMVAQGYGVTLLPEMMLTNGALPKNVTTHGFSAPIPTRKIGVVWRKKAPQEADFYEILKAIKSII